MAADERELKLARLLNEVLRPCQAILREAETPPNRRAMALTSIFLSLKTLEAGVAEGVYPVKLAIELSSAGAYDLPVQIEGDNPSFKHNQVILDAFDAGSNAFSLDLYASSEAKSAADPVRSSRILDAIEMLLTDRQLFRLSSELLYSDDKRWDTLKIEANNTLQYLARLATRDPELATAAADQVDTTLIDGSFTRTRSFKCSGDAFLIDIEQIGRYYDRLLKEWSLNDYGTPYPDLSVIFQDDDARREGDTQLTIIDLELFIALWNSCSRVVLAPEDHKISEPFDYPSAYDRLFYNVAPLNQIPHTPLEGALLLTLGQLTRGTNYSTGRVSALDVLAEQVLDIGSNMSGNTELVPRSNERSERGN